MTTINTIRKPYFFNSHFTSSTIHSLHIPGFYEAEYPDIPYPEVVDYIVSDATVSSADGENPDGTITLIINAVYPNGNTSLAYSHKTVIRLLDGDGFQYVSNEMISLEDERDIWWHSNRLTEEEWEEVYGGNE